MLSEPPGPTNVRRGNTEGLRRVRCLHSAQQDAHGTHVQSHGDRRASDSPGFAHPHREKRTRCTAPTPRPPRRRSPCSHPKRTAPVRPSCHSTHRGITPSSTTQSGAPAPPCPAPRGWRSGRAGCAPRPSWRQKGRRRAGARRSGSGPASNAAQSRPRTAAPARRRASGQGRVGASTSGPSTAKTACGSQMHARGREGRSRAGEGRGSQREGVWWGG